MTWVCEDISFSSFYRAAWNADAI